MSRRTCRRYVALLLPLALLTVAGTTGAANASPRAAGRAVAVSVTAVRPWQPGDKIWTTSPPAPAGFSIQATGCERVPSSGYLGHNVFASSTVEYSNYWSWSAASSVESFSWWVKNGSGTAVSHGSSAGGGGDSSVAANNLHWQVQNTGADPQAWTVCFDVH